MDAAIRWPDSLWATVTPPGPELPDLEGAAQADVIVIGARIHRPFDRAAFARSRRRRRRRRSDGAGLGRVGPQQRPGHPDAVAARSRRHYLQTWRGGRAVRRVVARQCLDAVRSDAALSNPGRAGADRMGAAGAFARPHQDRRAARPAVVEIRGAGRVVVPRADAPMLGSDAWFGGFWNRSGGHINPLALSRGLARVVLERGGRIYARSPAISFERRNDRWVVKTARGRSAAGP